MLAIDPIMALAKKKQTYRRDDGSSQLLLMQESPLTVCTIFTISKVKLFVSLYN